MDPLTLSERIDGLARLLPDFEKPGAAKKWRTGDLSDGALFRRFYDSIYDYRWIMPGRRSSAWLEKEGHRFLHRPSAFADATILDIERFLTGLKAWERFVGNLFESHFENFRAMLRRLKEIGNELAEMEQF